MKKFLFICFIFITTFITTFVFTLGKGKHIVVLDPGHGGSDSGIVIGGHIEKYIDLKLSEIIGEKLSKNENIKVIYTREGDVDDSIKSREIFANNGNGNLFVSIHCGSYLTDKNFGVVYLLNENDIDVSSADLLEGNIGDKTIKFFPFKIAGYYFLPKSENIATSMQNSLNSFYNSYLIKKPIHLKLRVLENIVMPGILIEVCNLNSESFTEDDKWYDSISDVISNEIIKFFSEQNKNE